MPNLSANPVVVSAEPIRPVEVLNTGGSPIVVAETVPVAQNIDAFEDKEERKAAATAKKAFDDAVVILKEGERLVITASKRLTSQGSSEFDIADADVQAVKSGHLKPHEVSKKTPSVAQTPQSVTDKK